MHFIIAILAMPGINSGIFCLFYCRHYDAHLRTLDEIRTGKIKCPQESSKIFDSKLEESKLNISKHKLINKHFLATGNLSILVVERLLGMEKETKALIQKLDEIRKGKLVTHKTY